MAHIPPFPHLNLLPIKSTRHGRLKGNNRCLRLTTARVDPIPTTHPNIPTTPNLTAMPPRKSTLSKSQPSKPPHQAKKPRSHQCDHLDDTSAAELAYLSATHALTLTSTDEDSRRQRVSKLLLQHNLDALREDLDSATSQTDHANEQALRWQLQAEESAQRLDVVESSLQARNREIHLLKVCRLSPAYQSTGES